MTQQEQFIELKAASTLLERGVFIDRVKAPFFLRLIGKKQLDITIHQPTLGEMVEISELIAQMGMDDNRLSTLNLSQGYDITSKTAILAAQILVIATRTKIPTWSRRRTASYLSRQMDVTQFASLWHYFISYNSVTDFINTIKEILPANFLSPSSQRSQVANVL